MIRRPLLVGLAGPSASGKSTLAERAQRELGGQLIKLDKFFQNEESFSRVGQWANWEIPGSLKLDELNVALERLKLGQPTEIPEYSKPLGRQTGTRIVEPAPVIWAEEFLLLLESSGMAEVVGPIRNS